MKVAIIGTAPSSRNLAPFDDPDFEIWGCSPYFNIDTRTFCDLPRMTKFFELHKWDEPALVEKLREAEADGYKRWLSSLECEVITQEPLKGCVIYPIEAVVEEFGEMFVDGNFRYFTNSIAYMIAYAILEGATEIHLYGVDMAADDEYGAQRPSCEFILGVAAGRGIKLHIPKVSDLLKCRHLYAFEESDGFDAKVVARRAEISQRLHHAKHEMEMQGRSHAAATAALGELATTRNLLNGQLTEGVDAAFKEREQSLGNQLQGLQAALKQSHEQVLALTGAEEDCKYWEQWK